MLALLRSRLNNDPERELRIAAEELDKRHDDPAIWSFWQRRFEKTAAWAAQHEREWRSTARPKGSEIGGEITISAPAGDFTLTARADRIDAIPGGGAVIDYKSGGTFSVKALGTGELPQLSLEGLILAKGGFAAIGALRPLSLQYWKMTGGAKPGEVIGVNDGVDAIVEKAGAGLKALIETFDNEKTPYYSLPRPANAPRFNDYAHLARIAEWAALGDDDESEAA